MRSRAAIRGSSEESPLKLLESMMLEKVVITDHDATDPLNLPLLASWSRLVHMSGVPPNHESLARAALPAYGRDPHAGVRLLSLSENATYLVDGDDPMVLRVHRPGYHSLDAIRSELAW